MEREHQFQVGDYVWAREYEFSKRRLGKIVDISENGTAARVQFGRGKPRPFAVEQLTPYSKDERSGDDEGAV